MAEKLKIELDRAAIGAWLRSAEMTPLLQAGAEQVKGRCGDGYDVVIMPTRAIALVETSTPEAYADNLKNNLGLLDAKLDVHCQSGEKPGPLERKEHIQLTNDCALFLDGERITVIGI